MDRSWNVPMPKSQELANSLHGQVFGDAVSGAPSASIHTIP